MYGPDSKMNVLAIAWDYTSAMDKDNEDHKIIGDTQARMVEYAKHLSKFFIITYSPKYLGLKTKKLSEKVTVYPTSSFSRFSFIYDEIKIASNIIKKEEIDLINAQDPFWCGFIGYLLKLRYNIPIVIQIFGEDLDNELWLKERKVHYLLSIMGKFLIKKADGVRVDSKKVEDYVKNNLGVSPYKIFNIPVFINIDKFVNHVVSIGILQKYTHYKNIVLFVGRLTKEKNIPNLIKAAPMVLNTVPNTLFLIVGQGDERPKLEKLVMELGIEDNFIFAGAVPDVADYYHLSDLLVLPSNHEGRAIVIVEAMACGKPVISTDVGGAHDVIVDEKTGYIVPVNNSDLLAQKMIYLLENPGLSKEMGRNGQVLVKKTQDIFKNAYKYRELCEKTLELARGRNE